MKITSKKLKRKILIIGDGTIGFCFLHLAKLYGQDLFFYSKHLSHLKIAKEIGATVYLLGNSLPSVDFFDVVVETVGRNQTETLNLGINSCKKDGTLIIAGVYPEGYLNSVLLRNLCYKQIFLRGSNSYSYSDGVDEFKIASNLLKKKKLYLKELVTHKFPLSDFKSGIFVMKNKKESGAIKVIFNP